MCARLPYEYIPCAINLNYCAHIQNNEFKSSSANIQKKKMGKMYWPLGDCLSGEGGGGGDGGSGSHRTLSPNEI